LVFLQTLTNQTINETNKRKNHKTKNTKSVRLLKVAPVFN